VSSTLEALRIGGFVGVWLAILIWPILLLYLNPRFDPDWKHKRWTELEATVLPMFSVFRMSLYVPAVCSRFCARRLFGAVEGERYDFRGRAGPLLYVLCMVELVAGVGGGTVGSLAHYALKLLD